MELVIFEICKGYQKFVNLVWRRSLSVRTLMFQVVGPEQRGDPSKQTLIHRCNANQWAVGR
jgi:hypothetical protein